MSHDKQHRLLKEAWSSYTFTKDSEKKERMNESRDRKEIIDNIEKLLERLQKTVRNITPTDGLSDIEDHLSALVDSAIQLEEIYKKTEISKVPSMTESDIPEAF